MTSCKDAFSLRLAEGEGGRGRGERRGGRGKREGEGGRGGGKGEETGKGREAVLLGY